MSSAKASQCETALTSKRRAYVLEFNDAEETIFMTVTFSDPVIDTRFKFEFASSNSTIENFKKCINNDKMTSYAKLMVSVWRVMEDLTLGSQTKSAEPKIGETVTVIVNFEMVLE